jgi:uncharacterized coiled-coil DUF342 family protein
MLGLNSFIALRSPSDIRRAIGDLLGSEDQRRLKAELSQSAQVTTDRPLTSKLHHAVCEVVNDTDTLNETLPTLYETALRVLKTIDEYIGKAINAATSEDTKKELDPTAV